MSGADDARTALQAALGAPYKAVFAAGGAYAQAQKAVTQATELEETMSAALTLVVAAEALKDAATEAEKAARAALTTAIQDTGAPEVITLHFRAAMASKAAFASANQPDLTPEEYMTKPQPDRKLILEDMKRGVEVPGWSLLTPNAQVLRITKRK